MSLTTDEPTIGGITSRAVPTCQPEATPSAVRAQLRGEAYDSTATIYVCEGVGEGQRLVGRLDSTDLLQSTDVSSVGAVMEPVRAVLHPDANREDAVLLAIETDRTEIPVIESDGRFLGAVTAQAIIDTMHQEHLEDVLRRAGVRHTGEQISDIASERVRDALRNRIPWLLFGLVAGLGLSVISSQFEATMRETIALAFFPPVVAYIADSVGTQSEAIAIRAFALREVEYGAYLRRELGVGVVVGGVLGILGGSGAVVIRGSISIGVVVGLSLFISSAAATVLASLIPIGFIVVGVDPALGSGPLATALQDGLSLMIYFLFAVVLL